MIKHDYKPENSPQISLSKFSWQAPAWLSHPYMILAMALSILALGIVLSLPDEEDETLALEEVNQVAEAVAEEYTQAELDPVYGEPIEIPLEISPVSATSGKLSLFNDELDWQSEAVKSGDNLSKIFSRIGLSAQTLYTLVNLDDNTKRLKNLLPGELISYQLLDSGELNRLKYALSLEQTLIIERQQDTFVSRIDNKTIEYRSAYAAGVIEDSLFLAGKKARLTDSQVMQLAGIFDWDIDFILDIREGDSFSVIFEEKYLDGEMIGHGDIIAAEFINQGARYQAVRYTDSQGFSNYYTPEGLSMRKAFLRAPLKFSYISSNFKPHRFHPILKKWKAHRGIDYRAPTGTPIRAAGDGKVIESGYNQYNGKYVFLQHGQGIVTKYLHMSKRAVSKNKRVRQGEVIGYVGATGLAEAPHLHYEFLVNGVHKNPRTVSLPKAEPVASSEKNRFLTMTEPLLSELAARNAVLQSNLTAH